MLSIFKQKQSWGSRPIGSLLAALFLLVYSPVQAQNTQHPDLKKWYEWIEFGGFLGSDNASRGEVAFWYPLSQNSDSLIFSDFRGKLFEKDFQEGNLAIGYRKMMSSGWNYGLWGGGDLRSSRADNMFLQAAGGVELLSEKFDFRANGYVPLSDPKSAGGLAEVSVSGGNLQMIGGKEVPMHGFDAEIGVKLFEGSVLSHGSNHELRVFGGGFWFDDKDAHQEIAGPRARAEWRVANIIPSMAGSRLTLEAEYSHDDVRNDKWEIGFRIRIPLGSTPTRAASLTPQEKRMSEALERDTDIVTGQSEAEAVEDANTGTDITSVTFVEGGGNLTTTATTQGAGALIVARNGTFGATTLQANQTLQGGGTTGSYRGLRTGNVSGYTAPGGSGTIDANTGTVLTLASGNSIVGITVSGGGSRAVNVANNHGIGAGGSVTNVVIDGVTIENIGDSALSFGGGNEVTINNTTIRETNNNGMSFGSNNTWNMNNVSIQDPGNNSMQFLESNNITIANSTFAGAGNDGILFRNALTGGNTLSVNSTTFSGTFGDDVFEFNLPGNTVSGSGNTSTATATGTFCEQNTTPAGSINFSTGPTSCP